MSNKETKSSLKKELFNLSPELQASLLKYAQSAKSLIDENADSLKNLSDKILATQQLIEPIIKNINTEFFKKFKETFDRLNEANKERAKAYPQLAKNIQEIAKQGWFLSLHMDFSSYEKLAFSLNSIPEGEKRREALDRAFSKCYSEQIGYFLDEILKRYPAREFAVRPAVNAHSRGEYALSIPVFFSQAEGILRDETEKELFTKRGHISDYAEEQRKEIPDPADFFLHFDDAIWAPLCGDLPIAWGPQERKENKYDGLNRNTTLHGIDLNYASEVNSLKAFSLLSYVAGLFDRAD